MINLGGGEGMQVPCTLHFKGRTKFIVVLRQQLQNIGTQSVQELFFLVIGVFVELFTVMIWLSFFGLRCTARRKLEIYN